MYQILIRLLSPLLILVMAIEAYKRGGGWRFFSQRLGFNYPSCQSIDKQTIWIHCASVGEVVAAEPLINEVIGKPNQYQLIVTTNTPTGFQQLQQTFASANIQHYYCPLDWPFAIHKFIKTCQPQQLWVMETEIWPNLYKISHHNNIKIKILNARLSKKTLNAPAWLQSSYHSSLNLVDQILSRSDAETRRFIQMGAPQSIVKTIGNIKYAKLNQLTSAARPISRAYILVASTHQDEEYQIAKRWLQLKRPELLVIVPRHPKRSKKIQQQLATLTAELTVASQQQQPNEITQIHLVDQLGKLMPLYQHAELVIMGGSFVEKGGHNILEPAAFAKAILTGSDMSDFESETESLLLAKGIIQCPNYQSLFSELNKLIDNPELQNQLGTNAKTVVMQHNDILKSYSQALNLS